MGDVSGCDKESYEILGANDYFTDQDLAESGNVRKLIAHYIVRRLQKNVFQNIRRNSKKCTRD